MIVLITGSLAYAQLSPGDLHKAHAFLEGIENCTKCHSQGQKLNPQSCLDCHTLLAENIRNNRGLHAGNGYRQCADCHIDHLGRNYQLVYWGKEGRDAFDHSKTGYTLQGAHQKIKCSACHNPQHIRDQQLLISKGKDLDRTFLGLDQQCKNCHQDEHRGQLKDDCLTCHIMDSWKNVPGFDHNKTQFKLSGRHINVQCQKCHKIIRDDKYPDNPTFYNFSIRKFSACSECHTDVHQNRFGADCSKCHNTSGWNNYNENNFDHRKTNFPLNGKHVLVQCRQCHIPGRPMKISRYQNCIDCHADRHQGQFAKRDQKGACEECHTVEGFSPSKFTLEMHQLCDYPLQGSHLAVPCLDCHKSGTSSVHQARTTFRFISRRCISCHSDIHQGQVSAVTDKNGCEGCHTVDSWRRVAFDHNTTSFPLQGRHEQAKCILCHAKDTNTGASRSWHFKNVSKDCSSCHEDIHQGQFSHLNENTDCSRCHSPLDWFADHFDHEKDSNFSLQGAHRFVTCDKCHFVRKMNGRDVTIYKPVDRRCEACHKQ